MRKLFSILLAFLLLLLCGCQKETVAPNWAAAENKASAPSADADGWQEKYDLGVRYLNDGNYEEAAIAFTAAIKIDPKNPDAYSARGGAYLSMAQESGDAAQYAQAADDLKQAGALGDESAERRERLAEAYIALGDEEGAEGEYLTLIATSPKTAYFDWLIAYYRSIGDNERADEIAKQAYEMTGEEKYRVRRLTLEEAEALRAYTDFLLSREDWAFAVADLDGDGVMELIAGKSTYASGLYAYGSASGTLTFDGDYFIYAYLNGDVCQVADEYVDAFFYPEVYVTDTGAVVTHGHGTGGYYGTTFTFWNGTEVESHTLAAMLTEWDENEDPFVEYMIDADMVSEDTYNDWIEAYSRGKRRIYPVPVSDENLRMLTQGYYAGLLWAGQICIVDGANILTDDEQSELEQLAREASEQYGVGVYVMITGDYLSYEDSTIAEIAETYFAGFSLGMGEERNGILLLIDFENREYGLAAHGSKANRVFTDHGKQLLRENFLDDFGSDDWYNGAQDYIRECARLLKADANGTPVA